MILHARWRTITYENAYFQRRISSGQVYTLLTHNSYRPALHSRLSKAKDSLLFPL